MVRATGLASRQSTAVLGYARCRKPGYARPALELQRAPERQSPRAVARDPAERRECSSRDRADAALGYSHPYGMARDFRSDIGSPGSDPVRRVRSHERALWDKAPRGPQADKRRRARKTRALTPICFCHNAAPWPFVIAICVFIQDAKTKGSDRCLQLPDVLGALTLRAPV